MDVVRDLLRFESREIRHFFDKARIEGQRTPQDISDRREGPLRNFVQKYFPFPYKVTKGSIIDSYGERSNSIDCILLSPSHPYTANSSDQYSLIFADGVDAAIELKPDLTTTGELTRGLRQIASVRSLRRKRSGNLGWLKKDPRSPEVFYRIPSFIFSMKQFQNVRITIEKIAKFYVSNNIPRELYFDFICIDGWGVIFNHSKNSYFYDEQGPEGIMFLETGDDTIAYFLYLLINIPKSELSMAPNVMGPYLSFNFNSYKTFNDINTWLPA